MSENKTLNKSSLNIPIDFVKKFKELKLPGNASSVLWMIMEKSQNGPVVLSLIEIANETGINFRQQIPGVIDRLVSMKIINRESVTKRSFKYSVNPNVREWIQR